ncbi:MAG: FtsQ-type POTRA domain-containing protein [Candidatus Atribacteria bacterium]|nr:FtsQ-type POTRA domain-containing protein [Candidatus Atribacteria bacterium]
MHGTLFKVSNIEITGNRTISTNEIEKASGVQKGKSIFGIRSWEVQKNLEKIRGIKRVEVEKVFPHLVRITIWERILFARVVVGGSSFCVDDEGIDVKCQPAPPDRIVTIRLSVNRKSDIRRLLEVIKAWQEGFDSPLREVSLSGDSLFILHLQNDIFIKCEGASNLLDKTLVLKPLLREVQVKSLKVVGFDLRMKKDIVLLQNKEEIY